MRLLLVGDLHLTLAPRDDYRWQTVVKLHAFTRTLDLDALVLLGDLTDEKDKHQARLVNCVVAHLCEFAAQLPVHIVRGNHDGIDPEWPYFKFTERLRNVWFYHEPSEMSGQRDVLVLPHSRDPLRDWQDLKFKQYKAVLAHVTVNAATSESGIALRSDIDAAYFKERGVRVYSGDVHVPQRMGPILYVGAPYPIRFGDEFVPRVVLLDTKTWAEESIDLPSIERFMLDVYCVEDLNNVPVGKGDQAKVRLHLPDDQLGTWLPLRKKIIARCKERGLDLASVELVREEGVRPIMSTPKPSTTERDVLKAYVDEHKIPRSRAEVGEALLATVKNAL